MTNRRTYLTGVTALLAALATTTPATGTGVGISGPRMTCGFLTQGTGSQQTGYLWGGPWVPDTSVDAAGPTTTESEQVPTVVMTCTIRIVDGEGHVVQQIPRSSPATPLVGLLLPTPVAFPVGPGPRQGFAAMDDGPTYNIEVCTEVTVHTNGNPPDHRQYDADNNPANGPQCDPATRENPDDTDIVIYSRPNHADGDICTYVDDQSGDPPYACLPWGSIV